MSMFSKLLGMASGSAPPPEPIKVTSNKVANKSPSSSKNSGASSASQRRPVAIDEEQRQRIMRLKAARLAEKKASAPTVTAAPKTKSASSARSSTSKASTPARSKPTTFKGRNLPPITPPAPTGPRQEKKKLNFKEIMQQAEKIDSQKLKVTIKNKTKTPTTSSTSTTSGRVNKSAPVSRNNTPTLYTASKPISRAPQSSLSSTLSSLDKPISRSSSTGAISSVARKKRLEGPSETVSSASRGPSTSSAITSNSKLSRLGNGNLKKTSSLGGKSSKVVERPKSLPASKPKTPAPFAKPMQKLLDKRKDRELRSARYDDEYDEDMDDFIVNDEDDEDIIDVRDDEEDDGYYGRTSGRSRSRYDEDPGYDREEIWSMFSRGKRRADYMEYEDDLSDMEATGEDVLREEMRSTRMARREDEEQERELRRHAEEKARRKKTRRD